MTGDEKVDPGSADPWVRRVATGCTDMGTALIGGGGVLYGVLLVGAFALPHEYANDACEVMRNPLVIIPSIPYWLSAIGLLEGGLRLMKPRESVRLYLGRTSLLLIVLWAAAFACVGTTEVHFAIAAGEDIGFLVSTVWLIVFMPGLPSAIAIGYLWRLRDALWSPAMIAACRGVVPNDLERARRNMHWQARHWVVGTMAVASLITLWVMRGVEY